MRALAETPKFITLITKLQKNHWEERMRLTTIAAALGAAVLATAAFAQDYPSRPLT